MNSVNLVGRLTRDPEEIRYIAATQTAVTTFTLAVSRTFDKDGKADFIRIIVYGKTAENCASYLAKGSLAGVKGRIQTGSYEDKAGEKRYTTDVIAENVEFLARPQTTGKVGNDVGIPEGFHEFEEDENIPF